MHNPSRTGRKGTDMAVSRTHRYIVDPADLDELIARRATLIAAIRAAHPGLAEARLTRPQAINAIKALLVTAPDDLRQQLRDLSVTQLVRTAARLRPGAINDLDTELDRLTAKTAARLVALFGVGTDSAGALLVAAGDNPDRLRSEAAFSMLCGSSPI